MKPLYVPISFSAEVHRNAHVTRLRDERVREIHLKFNIRDIAVHKPAHVRLVFL